MVIDFHVHLGWVKSFAWNLKGRIYVELEDLLSYMDGADVDLAVVLSIPSGSDPYSNIISNEELWRIASKARDRLIPFCVVDPRDERAINKLDDLIELGFKGFGEFKIDLKIEDDRVIRILRRVNDYGLPLLFHMEDNKYFYDIYALDKALAEFSEINFIAHGPGWWKHISGELTDETYPKGKIRREGMVQRVLRKHENIFADISATSGLNALKRDLDYARSFLEEFSDKILYGTDFPCLCHDGSQFGPNMKHLVLLEALGLSDSVLDKITHLNAEKVLFGG